MLLHFDRTSQIMPAAMFAAILDSMQDRLSSIHQAYLTFNLSLPFTLLPVPQVAITGTAGSHLHITYEYYHLSSRLSAKKSHDAQVANTSGALDDAGCSSSANLFSRPRRQFCKPSNIILERTHQAERRSNTSSWTSKHSVTRSKRIRSSECRK